MSNLLPSQEIHDVVVIVAAVAVVDNFTTNHIAELTITQYWPEMSA